MTDTMVHFLTPAWLAAFDDAARSLAPDVAHRFVLEMQITDAPSGRIGRYQLVIDERVSVASGDPADPAGVGADLTIVVPWPVAVAVARGDDNAQHALARGELRVHGHPDGAAAAAAALTALGDALATLRARTEFPSVS